MFAFLLSVAIAQTTFTDSKGVKIDADKALKLSYEQGETFIRCQPVKADISKSGTSITFKVVK